MSSLSIALNILIVSLLAMPAFAYDLSKAKNIILGRASVIDGDTIEIHGSKIRIWGVDAPEKRQQCQNANGQNYKCGQNASLALQDWLNQSQPLRCETNSKDRYKRFVARCFRADGAEMAEWLVYEGYAVDWPRYSKGFYEKAQNEAQALKNGVWQGEFIMPWHFRGKRK